MAQRRTYQFGCRTLAVLLPDGDPCLLGEWQRFRMPDDAPAEITLTLHADALPAPGRGEGSLRWQRTGDWVCVELVGLGHPMVCLRYRLGGACVDVTVERMLPRLALLGARCALAAAWSPWGMKMSKEEQQHERTRPAAAAGI